MVWALFLIILGEQKNFNSHMIATYATIEECDEAALGLQRTWSLNKRFGEKTFVMKNGRYECVPIPKQ